MGRPEKIRLGEVLVAQKLISQDQLKQGLDTQKRTGQRIGRILVEARILTDEQLAEALARQLGLPFLNLKYYNFNRKTSSKLPEQAARRFRAIALEDRGATFFVGMSDPTDLFAHDELTRVLRKDIEAAVVVESQALQTIDQIYRKTEEITGLARELEQDLGEGVVDFGALGATLGAEEAPVVKLLQSLFEDAIQVGASDIHIEPQEGRLQVRIRVDGVLHVQTEADNRIASAVALRLKLMAGLDISEKRQPQDGRFNVKVRDQTVDVRISTLPTQYGESVVMRLLSRASGLLELDALGMPPDMLGRFRAILSHVTGMVLVTGPTGSGKTTTLYSALAELNTADRKVITVEDPVEYRMRGLNQVQVNEKIDLTFAKVLRSVLRQDPNIILVGEMRDAETAQIGLRAAITGHMVLSTLHTKDATSAAIRLLDMGAPAYMVSSSLEAVIAQRLVRLVCESCTQDYQPTSQEMSWLEIHLEASSIQSARFKRGAGCSHCNGTGKRGRLGVYEMLELSQSLAGFLAFDTPSFLRAAGEAMRGKTLLDNGLRLACEGRVTVSEVMRISQVEE